MLHSREPRNCGLCGQFREPTRAHVPPRAAGNTGAVQRAPDVIDMQGIRRPGRWSSGGLWVRGLCFDCNNLAGGRYDAAYRDFAASLRRMSTPTVRQLLVYPREPAPATLAPGLVARAVLFGMYATHPRLRMILPELADDLRHERPDLRWPSHVRLRVGLAAGDEALLFSGVSMHRVLGRRMTHFSFVDVVFPPLAWCLVPDQDDQIAEQLAEASEWPLYSPDRTSVDLRNLTRTFPLFNHPVTTTDRDSWIELMGEAGTDAEPVILHGRLA